MTRRDTWTRWLDDQERAHFEEPWERRLARERALDATLHQTETSLDRWQDLRAESEKTLDALERLARERLRPYATRRRRLRIVTRIRVMTARFYGLAWVQPRAVALRAGIVGMFLRIIGPTILRIAAAALAIYVVGFIIVHFPDIIDAVSRFINSLVARLPF